MCAILDPRKAPFTIHGLYNATAGGPLRRLPLDVAEATSKDVTWLSAHTAGGRIRFATDATRLTVHVKIGEKSPMYHATPIMEGGISLYYDEPTGSRYAGPFCFDPASYSDYTASRDMHPGHKELTLYLPLYGHVADIEIEVNEGATIAAHSPYRNELPVVYYGSSITQGGCAGHPGTDYPSIISRRYNCDFTNLGFSGSAKAEDAIVNYMADLPMCAFVSDYDHNAPSHEHLAATHHKLYEAVREKHPDIPYLMVTKPDFYYGWDERTRRDIIMESYLAARRAGDQNVYFVDGSLFFVGHGHGLSRADFTVDTCHPNDLGFSRMAEVIGEVLGAAMHW